MKTSIFVLFAIFILHSTSLQSANTDVRWNPETSSDLSSSPLVDYPVNEDMLTASSVLRARPDIGGDVEGGGDNGIGRESAPVADISIEISLLLMLLYSSYLTIKKNNAVLQVKK